MSFLRTLLLLGTLLGLMGLEPIQASTCVLILSGLAGDQNESTHLQVVRQAMVAGFIKRGIPREAVQEAGDVDRAGILDRLAKIGANLKADDLLWLVILGHAEVHDDGPVLETRGQRLTDADLKAALDAIPARQYVILTTENSGAFIPKLAAKNRVILTATEPGGEINDTVFPDAFAEALTDAKSKSLLDLAKKTAELVAKSYDDQHIIQTEHALLSDPNFPTPLTAPFDKTSGAGSLMAETAPKEHAQFIDQPDMPDEPTPIPVPETIPANRQPATPETLALIKQAQVAAQVDGDYPFVIVSRETSIMVNRDLSRSTSVHEVSLVKKTMAVHRGDFDFANTPEIQTDVKLDRVIFPDGTYWEARDESHQDVAAGDMPATQRVTSLRLPMVAPGCVIETILEKHEIPDPSVDDISETTPLTEEVPILNSALTLLLPKEDTVRYQIRNMPGQPDKTTTGEYSHMYHWTWQNLAAVEPQEFDPPIRDIEGELVLSSFVSWSEFADWYQRISEGSDVIGDLVKKRAAVVTANMKTDHQKLKALFEEVSHVHYTAIEIGVGGFRPHTPEWVLQHNYGDCKDKANLLIALAKQVGIPGKFVLLNRASSTDKTFPSFQFNHALTYFPTVDGGLFLDATDEITPYGQMPPGDVQRDAFFVSDRTFKTIPTPASQATRYQEHLVVDLTGRTAGLLTIDAQGLADYGMRGVLRRSSARGSDRFFRSLLDSAVPGATLDKYSVSDVEKLDVPLHAELTFSILPDEGIALPRQMHLPMNLMNAIATPSRSIPLVLNDGQPFQVEQTIDFVGLSTDSLPPAVQASAPGSTASVSFSQTHDTITRKLVINVTQPTVAPQDYPAFRSMIQSILTGIMNSPTSPR